jgi:hypothetical protein
MVLGAIGMSGMGEELAGKRANGARELLVSVAGDGGEGPGVQLVLGVGARLVVVGSCAKLLQESLKLPRAIELQLPALALKQEADGADAGMSEELAVKRLDRARETIVVVGGGDGEALGVQLVLGVGARLVVVGSCAKFLQESLKPRRTFERHRPALALQLNSARDASGYRLEQNVKAMLGDEEL